MLILTVCCKGSVDISGRASVNLITNMSDCVASFLCIWRTPRDKPILSEENLTTSKKGREEFSWKNFKGAAEAKQYRMKRNYARLEEALICFYKRSFFSRGNIATLARNAWLQRYRIINCLEGPAGLPFAEDDLEFHPHF